MNWQIKIQYNNGLKRTPRVGPQVEKLLLGGIHTAVVTVKAEVCLKCGERLYSTETVRRFEQIRKKLERQELTEFLPLGQSFQVV